MKEVNQLSPSGAVFGCRWLSAVGLILSLWVSSLEATRVNAQPSIGGQPGSHIVPAGGNVAFRVTATGTSPESYQWYFNGLGLPGATNSSLVLTNVQRASAGQYWGLVANSGGSTTSQVARLDVYVRAGIFDIADPEEFDKILSTNAVLTRLATISDSWLEGPVWIPSDGGYLVFSATDERKLKKLVPPATLTNYLSCAPNTTINGNLLDLHERLISCQYGSAGLKVVLTTNGVTVPLVTQYTNGLKFYAPNDLAIKSDGTIWFTDPGYNSVVSLPIGSSVPRGYQPGLFVYFFSETNGNATVQQVITNMFKPNGICFSPDETKLYVADNPSWPVAPGLIRVFEVNNGNTVTGGSVLCTVGEGIPDGIRCDVDGRIWAGAGDGVEIFAPDGHLIATIRLSPLATNLCFGGPEYKTLYIVGQPYVSSIPVLVPGAVSIKRLAVSYNGTRLSLGWPAPSTGFTLQASDALGSAANWTDVAQSPGIINDSNTVNIEPTTSVSFFRLRLK
jgi:gluconolactonase